jgi:hypothetical protein
VTAPATLSPTPLQRHTSPPFAPAQLQPPAIVYLSGCATTLFSTLPCPCGRGSLHIFFFVCFSPARETAHFCHCPTTSRRTSQRSFPSSRPGLGATVT